MRNPFVIHEIPVDGVFCNRQKELKDLVNFAKNGINVVLYSPRRYGKTSLVKRVQHLIQKEGFLTVYCDLFGVTSVEDIATKISKSLYKIVYSNEKLLNKFMRLIASFKPTIQPDPSGGVTISVTKSTNLYGLDLLEDVLESVSKIVNDNELKLHIAFDEFQEITEIDNSLQIEAILRRYIQTFNISVMFVGSRRRILLDMFSNIKRPFYQSANLYELKALPYDELKDFIKKQFKQNGKTFPESLIDNILEVTKCHPYYSQKYCYYVFDLAENKVDEKVLKIAFNEMLLSEKPIYEAVIQGLSSKQIQLLRAIAIEPTKSPFAVEYMRKYNLGSISAIQNSIKKLQSLDLIEKKDSKLWMLVDPILEIWLKEF
ncbi:AAA family ATPase [Deferribacter abyssi]|uniref:AAA family ATPase n=1 Tax=Deferribacter abyssi TaxID=213806 RepID=UPI003C1FC945